MKQPTLTRPIYCYTESQVAVLAAFLTFHAIAFTRKPDAIVPQGALFGILPESYGFACDFASTLGGTGPAERTAILARYAFAPSYHIQGNHPTREIAPEDRAGRCWIVAWQCGFEQFQLAVWGDGLSASDADEAAVEWMEKHKPEWFSKEDHSPDHVYLAQ